MNDNKKKMLNVAIIIASIFVIILSIYFISSNFNDFSVNKELSKNERTNGKEMGDKKEIENIAIEYLKVIDPNYNYLPDYMDGGLVINSSTIDEKNNYHIIFNRPLSQGMVGIPFSIHIWVNVDTKKVIDSVIAQ